MVYLIGFYYDDFDEGGFSVVGVADSEERIEEIFQAAKAMYPNLEFDYRPYPLNKFHEYEGE